MQLLLGLVLGVVVALVLFIGHTLSTRYVGRRGPFAQLCYLAVVGVAGYSGIIANQYVIDYLQPPPGRLTTVTWVLLFLFACIYLGMQNVRYNAQHKDGQI